MTLEQDINNLPEETFQNQPGHISFHNTLHQAIKAHQLRLNTLDGKTSSNINDATFGTVASGLSYLGAELGTKPSYTEVNNSLAGKANVSHTHTIANVTNLQATLDTKPTLVNGKLPTSYLDQVNLGETLTASSQAAMLALAAQPGDVAIRSDNDTLWMLKKAPATTLANWWDLTAAMSGIAGVTSINTMTGVVTIGKSDVGLANVDNTSDAAKPVSTATQTALNAKQNAASAVSGSANGTATALTLWTGTAAQYAAIATKSSSTIYVVTG